jgi:hypothetical protein
MRPDVFLFGDSHSLSVFAALESAAAKYKFTGAFAGASGCLPFLGMFPLSRNDHSEINCNALNRRVFEFVKAQKIPTILLVARWTYYTDGRYDSPNALVFIGPTQDAVVSKTVSRQTFVTALQTTIEAYQAIGTKVVLMKQIPMQQGDARRAYFLARLAGGGLDRWIRRVSVPLQRHLEFQSFVNGAINRFEHEHGVEILDPTAVLCSHELCPFGTESASYYYDSDHLSLAGARLLEPLLKRAIANEQ